MEQVVYNFWGKKEHQLFCYNYIQLLYYSLNLASG